MILALTPLATAIPRRLSRRPWTPVHRPSFCPDSMRSVHSHSWASRASSCRIGWLGRLSGQGQADFRVGDGESNSIAFEHFSYIHGGIDINTKRTVYLRSVSDCDLTFGSKARGGELFLEDVVTHNLKLKDQRVWARQLNVENEGTHIVNDGGQLWVLGYKNRARWHAAREPSWSDQ